MNLAFKEIDESDVAELTRVMTRAFDDDSRRHLGVEKGGPDGYDTGEFFKRWLFGYEQTAGFKIVTGSAIIGAVIVWVFETGNNVLGTIFVDPEYQGQGVGLRTWAFIEAKYPSALSWTLETPAFATRNHRFYERCGFRRIEVKPPSADERFESWVYRKDMRPSQVLYRSGKARVSHGGGR